MALIRQTVFTFRCDQCTRKLAVTTRQGSEARERAIEAGWSLWAMTDKDGIPKDLPSLCLCRRCTTDILPIGDS